MTEELFRNPAPRIWPLAVLLGDRHKRRTYGRDFTNDSESFVV
jgi:hypothetical protein